MSHALFGITHSPSLQFALLASPAQPNAGYRPQHQGSITRQH
jgi:hypothetical protein